MVCSQGEIGARDSLRSGGPEAVRGEKGVLGWAFRREKREGGRSREESESLMSGLETGLILVSPGPLEHAFHH